MTDLSYNNIVIKRNKIYKEVNVIRKVVIGKEYTKDAMSYAVGQRVYRGQYVIDSIIQDDDKIVIYIDKDGEVFKWKELNPSVAYTLEYSLDFS